MTRSATEAALLVRAEEAEAALARCVAERQALERDRDAWQERCGRARRALRIVVKAIDAHRCDWDAALDDDPPAR